MRLAAARAAPSCRQTPLSCSRHRPSTCLWQSEPCSLEAICCALAPFATLAPPAVRRCQRAEAVRSLRATLARVGSGVLDGVPPRPPPPRPPSRKASGEESAGVVAGAPDGGGREEAPTHKERASSYGTVRCRYYCRKGGRRIPRNLFSSVARVAASRLGRRPRREP